MIVSMLQLISIENPNSMRIILKPVKIPMGIEFQKIEKTWDLTMSFRYKPLVKVRISQALNLDFWDNWKLPVNWN